MLHLISIAGTEFTPYAETINDLEPLALALGNTFYIYAYAINFTCTILYSSYIYLHISVHVTSNIHKISLEEVQ